MSELKPCPFCGGEYTQVRYMGGKWQEPSVFDSGYRGECCDCGVITAACYTEAEAIEAWNTRADDYRHAAEYWQHMYEEAFAERTCKMEPVWGTNALQCSECCSYVSTWDAECEIGKINYCPSCGAKVVSE